MPSVINQKILDTLVESQEITVERKDELLQRITNEQISLDSLLLQESILSEKELLEMKSKLMSVPYVLLRDQNISPDVLNLIPADASRNYKMIAFEADVQTLKVGMVNPYDIRAIEALDFLGKQANLKPEVYVISESDYEDGVKSYHTLGQEVASVLEKTEGPTSINDSSLELQDEKIKTAPVSKVVSVVIRHAVELGASDIHIEPDRDSSHVRYRIDGVLHTSLTLPLYMHAPVISRIKVLAKLKLDETRIPQDGRIKLKIDNRNVDLRISTLPLLEHEKVSMRILDTSHKIPGIEELGFSGSMKDKMERVIKRPFGIVLVTGPTGSGKTTTLYTLINQVNKPDVNITTLEDPIEYEIDGVNQSQIQPGIEYTFASGLRSLLRQDPDIIMVGEIRDVETAEMAIHAGLTGHLLFSTLHTNNAFGAIPRLIDMKVEPFLLASTLNAVIAQRLVRRVCDSCKEHIDITSDVAQVIKDSLKSVNTQEIPEGISLDGDIKIYQGKGCKECGGIGYKGRTSIGEILEVTEEMKQIINNGSEFEAVQHEAQRQGMVTMQQHGFIKVLQGITTYEEVMRVTKEES